MKILWKNIYSIISVTGTILGIIGFFLDYFGNNGEVLSNISCFLFFQSIPFPNIVIFFFIFVTILYFSKLIYSHFKRKPISKNNFDERNSYTKDTMFDMTFKWKWHKYYEEPQDIKAYCPKCGLELSKNERNGYLRLYCLNDEFEYKSKLQWFKIIDYLEKEIVRRIESKT